MKILNSVKILFLVFALCCLNGHVNADIIINAHSPAIAFDGAGNFVAVWEADDVDTGTTVIQAANYLLSSGEWSDPVIISDTAQNALNPTVRMNSSGNAIAIWASSDGTNTWLQGSFLPLAGTWSTLFNISTGDDIVYSSPGSYTIDIDSSGNIFIAWTSESITTGLTSINSSTAIFGGGWTNINISEP